MFTEMETRLLPLLCCPETTQSVRLADATELAKLNAHIQSGCISNCSGHMIDSPLEAALIREDHRIVYPIRDGIPLLVIEEAIATLSDNAL
jgi:uncharacterized protein YbaR (Trm112 family)